MTFQDLNQGFLPIYDQQTQILILGTAPSVISLKKQQYYANPGNQFWKIIFMNLAVDDPIDYQKRIEILKEHRIGLWDVYKKFERQGSLDTNFSTIIPNDFRPILNEAPIHLIIANGKLAYKEALKNPTLNHLPIIPVLSTSGANNGLAKERLISWREAFERRHIK
ncbi:DNA-deoxyinosine glycosylase [Enterococcus sp.]|uniref:DNA-deoxyinosine glycosylase n=1 Tax=Enterococcus sp. TaxID=35783 RepID=UPI002FCC2F4D